MSTRPMLLGSSPFTRSMMPMRQFSVLTNNFKRFIAVDAQDVNEQSDNILLRLHLHSAFDINVKRSDTLRAIHDAVVYQQTEESTDKQHPANHVEFFSSNGHRLPLCEVINDLVEDPVIMQINRESLIAINFNTSLMFGHESGDLNQMNEEYYFDYYKGIGLPPKERLLFANFS
eukprot:CAMPEP_0176371488 /NCGR_PEP_ID=MMETSP0126-20121128/24735_1 /TAXON_ID=141414 ORGANISM="Strombidinopsis acuminatum, Strain SPMC142" /NCGR_SAMPLE_ID=MMETSP0126 /ASSEMBLY_ACC=CAM_ASM_000229 /LENGTH=173 /DNA_ID=CAMNT_0017730969 /DNA_START=96 /DNA_END=617 /DNA_ORIENTATION=-